MTVTNKNERYKISGCGHRLLAGAGHRRRAACGGVVLLQLFRLRNVFGSEVSLMIQRITLVPLMVAVVAAVLATPHPSAAQELGELKTYPNGPTAADKDIRCRNGEALKGILCNTDDCDKKRIVCQVYSETVDTSTERELVRMQENEKIELSDFAYGIDDRDNLVSPFSLSTDLLARRDNCSWVSASGTNHDRICGESRLVTGVSCDGEFCEDLEIQCCRAVVVQQAAEVPEEDPEEGPEDVSESEDPTE